MNLQQMRYLVAAADAGSVSGAARAVGVSQPVVSRALHNLEREYRVVLFRKSGRCLELTEVGAAVVVASRQALAAVREVERTAQRGSSDSELAMVTTPTNGMLLSPVVTSFISQRPLTALRLRRASDMDELVRMVGEGDSELGFGEFTDNPADASLHFEPLWLATVLLVSPIGTELPPAVSWSELAGSRLVLPPEGSERRRQIVDAMVAVGAAAPSAALATDERSAWISSAQQGIGSFFCYQTIAADLPGVECRPFDPPIQVKVGFIYRSETLSPEGRELLGLAKTAAVPAGCQRIEATAEALAV